MRTKAVLISLLAIIGMMATAQRPTIELTFTAVNNTVHVRMDSIKVMNRTKGGSTVLYWPDTVLSIYYVGISEISKEKNGFRVFQNYPNPVNDQTTISLYVPGKDKVSLIVTDIVGRVILKTDRVLDQGTHSFRFTPGGANLYFFTAQWRGMSSSIKILQAASHAYGSGSLEYTGSDILTPQLKVTKDIQDLVFSPGDELLYIGYFDALQSGMLDTPEDNQTYTFQFATNIPCFGTSTVEYEGQVYNTIQIFSQCWLKENLNVGVMINSLENMQDNGAIEKYCYNNEPDSCTKYGGLYQWDEMMQYTTQQGVQGICPPGWHLPTDEEWKVLEGSVDSQFGIGDQVWEEWWAYRGFDAGSNMKTTSGWWGDGNGSDLFGFSALPAGTRDSDGSFTFVDEWTGWWSTWVAGDDGAWGRFLYCYFPTICRSDYIQDAGFSVRCLRDE